MLGTTAGPRGQGFVNGGGQGLGRRSGGDSNHNQAHGAGRGSGRLADRDYLRAGQASGLDRSAGH